MASAVNTWWNRKEIAFLTMNLRQRRGMTVRARLVAARRAGDTTGGLQRAATAEPSGRLLVNDQPGGLQFHLPETIEPVAFQDC